MLVKRIKIPAKFKAAVSTPKRYKIFIGGRGGAKSHTFTDIFIAMVEKGAKVCCLREYQNSIDESVYSLIDEEIRNLDAPGYTIYKSHIDNESGGKFRFKGLTGKVDTIRSFFGFNIFWVEEAQFLSGDSLKALTPTLREEGSEFWMSANPISQADPFSQRFIVPFQKELDRDGYYEDDMHMIVRVNYDDNPWFPDVLEQERVNDYNSLSRAEYDHIWRGAFNDSVENAIITKEMFDSAIDAHVKLGFEPKGTKIIAHDPSDTGGDTKGLVYRHGSVILDAQAKETGDVNDGCEWALAYAINEQADLFIWDGDGMGIALQKQIREALHGKKMDWHVFKGSEAVERPSEIYDDPNPDRKKQRTNKQMFKNKRAQHYWALRDRFYNTWLAIEKGKYVDPEKMISVSSQIQNIDSLRTEICRIPRKHNTNGLFQVMDKEQMKKLGIQSPGQADSAMMSLDMPAFTARKHTKIKFKSYW